VAAIAILFFGSIPYGDGVFQLPCRQFRNALKSMKGKKVEGIWRYGVRAFSTMAAVRMSGVLLGQISAAWKGRDVFQRRLYVPGQRLEESPFYDAKLTSMRHAFARRRRSAMKPITNSEGLCHHGVHSRASHFDVAF
jgi:hypothetical protein